MTDRLDHQFQRLFIVHGNSQACSVSAAIYYASAVYIHNTAFLFLLKYLYNNNVWCQQPQNDMLYRWQFDVGTPYSNLANYSEVTMASLPFWPLLVAWPHSHANQRWV